MRSAIRPAVEHYHDLIARDPTGARQQSEALAEMQRERGVLFGDRVMARSLRPTFMAEGTYDRVQDVVYLIRQAVLRIASRHFMDKRLVCDELGLEEWEWELATLPTNVLRLSANARMDAFLTDDGFQFVEINGESPAGLAYIHELAQCYEALPVFQEFASRFPVRFISPLEHTMAALVMMYHEQFGGREERPTFAIVDRQDVPTVHEFRLIKAHLERRGFGCEVVDPRALECRGGWIYANGRQIDLLYRRLLMRDFYEMRDDCQAYEEGYRAQKTCYLNSFRTAFMHKKAIFAFLTDETYARHLTSTQREAIARHVPWTRRLRERRTSFRGLDIDLVPFVRANRQYFVLKPNDGYGGSGVTLGFEASEGDWDEALRRGLEEGHVVQEAIKIHREDFMVEDADGTWKLVPSVIDLAPYINGPLLGGCLTRTSATGLANVTSGGGTLPMFLLRHTYDAA